MKNTIIYFLAVFCLFFSPLHSIDDVKLHLKVIALEEASEPEIYFNKILFTVQPEEGTRHVGMALAHEGFRQIHSFQKNSHGVFFFLMDIPSQEHLDYRLIIDGIWQLDPQGEEIVSSSNGISLSRLTIPSYLMPSRPSPVMLENKMVEFHLQAEPGRLVYLSGSFNQWDPYMMKMEEFQPGHYRRQVRLSSGNHYYHYHINGEAQLDPNNRNIQINEFGEEVSALLVP